MKDQRKDQLIQQFEEAALGILMEEYADAEGARLLQAFETASRQGSVESMPAELSIKCEEIINQTCTRSHYRRLLSGITKAVGRAAVVAMVLFTVSSIAILSVDAWRVPVLNFILDENGDHASVNFEDTKTQTKGKYEQILDHINGCVPQGYELVNTPSLDGPSLDIRFQNSEGKQLFVIVQQSTSALIIDTEQADYIELEVAGNLAYLIQKDDVYIIWHDDKEELAYSVYADGLSADVFWAFVYSLAE